MNSGISHVDVGPHKFKRLGWLARRRDCRSCYVAKERHPVRGFTRARPMSGPPSWGVFIARAVAFVLALVVLALSAWLIGDAIAASPAQTPQPSLRYQGWTAKTWAKHAVQARKDANARGRTIKRLKVAQSGRADHFFAWLRGADCVHRHERGADGWATRTGNGYYGGMQADLSFQRAYAPAQYRRKWGTADAMPWWAQLHMAYRGWLARGWQPWPNTARTCGLL